MAKSAFAFPPQNKTAPAPAPAPKGAAPAAKQGGPRRPDSATMAKAILGARIANYVMSDPAISGDWLALVALCQAGRAASKDSNGSQLILALSVGEGAAPSSGATVFGERSVTGGAGNKVAEQEDTEDGGSTSGSSGSSFSGNATVGGSSTLPAGSDGVVIVTPPDRDLGGEFHFTTNPDGGVDSGATGHFKETGGSVQFIFRWPAWLNPLPH